MARYALKYKRCVNRYKNGRCDRCAAICPQKAIFDMRVDEKRCDGCGLCFAACPTQAIESSVLYERILSRLADQARIDFDCQKQRAESEFACLGFLSARLLYPFAARRAVRLALSGCKSCRSAVDDSLRRAAAECNDALPKERSIFIDEGEASPSSAARAIDRRGFLREMAGAAFSFLAEARQAEREETCYPFFWLQWARSELRDPAEVAAPLHPACAIGQTCNACRLCARICPQKALTVAEGDGAIRVCFDPLLCSACRICEVNCPMRAVSIADRGGAGRAFEIPLPRCARCGKLFQPVGAVKQCLECAYQGRLLR